MPTPSRVSCSWRLIRALSATAALAGSLLLLAPAARAVPVSGQLSIVGSLVLGATNVDFWPLGGGIGTFVVFPPATGNFSVLPPGATGTIADLNVSPGQVGSPISVANVIVLAALPVTQFDLTLVHPGAYSSANCTAAPAAGQLCTFPTSPALQLANVPNGFGLGSVLSFSLTGTVTDGSDVSNFTGTVTAQFTQPFQNVLATLGGGGTVASSYSAVFEVVPVPEASTLASLGLGVVLLALRRRPA